MTGCRWPRVVALAAVVGLGLVTMPHGVAATDCQEITDCLANSVRGSIAALAGVALLIGLFVAPEVFGPLLIVKGVAEAVTGRDLLTGQQLDWTQRALGVLPVLGEFGQEVRTGAEVLQEGEALAADEAAMSRGGGAFGDDVQPYEPEGPIQGQRNPDSCVAASCRMVHNSMTGEDMAEAMWRDAASVDETGGRMVDAADALSANGVPAQLREGMGITDLEQSTANGPAIVSGQGHALVVDRVSDGMVYIRDPEPYGTGSSYAVPVDRFTTWWDGRAVVTGSP